MPKMMLLRAGILLAAATLALPAQPQVTAPANTTTWMNAGSDIPVDPSWRLGTLPNGLRYAVRRGAQPNLVSVRVRIGVGALMESDAQLGWTHLLEHMTFRRTTNFADGEGAKVWQRIGARFGSDSNASTGLMSTSFTLDLPKSDSETFKQAMAVLADMVDNAAFDPTDLTAERKVVVAERAQRLSPLAAQTRATSIPLLYAGTKAAVRDVIGTEATLTAASAESLRAYYEAWYRPSNAVVVVVGDADPAALEAGVRTAFSAWQGSGAQPPDPDWGSVRTPASPAMVVTQPQASESFTITFVAPHDESPWTVARQQRQFTQSAALGILSQRLAAAARKGEAIVGTTVGYTAQRRSGDLLSIQIVPKPGQWKEALDQTYKVLNGATAASPAQEEVDQQAATITANLNQRVASAPARGSASLASGLLGDFENGDVTVAPEYFRAMFDAQRSTLTPASVGALLRGLLQPAPRLLVVSTTPVAGGNAAAVAALASARTVRGEQMAAIRAVSIDQLVLTGKPATIVSTNAITPLGAERILLSNGTELVIKKTPSQKDRMNVAVQVGEGLLGLPRDELGLHWSVNALRSAGLGPFTVEELGRMSAGRQIVFTNGSSFTASLTMSGVSNGKDIGDMLTLMGGQIAQPRFAETSVARLRDGIASSYKTNFAQPTTVQQGFGGPALHGGDMRFQGTPPLEAVQRLSLSGFQGFWNAVLAQGPRRVVIVGDFDRDAVIAAVCRTLGTFAVRTRPKPSAGGDQVRATLPAAPVILRHQGQPTQTLVTRAFSTIGSLDDKKESQALNVAATLVGTRLVEGFRGQQGASYAPSVGHAQSSAMAHYGVFLAGAQMLTSDAPLFDKALDGVLTDLAANGPSDDAFQRAKSAALNTAQRNLTDINWWVNILMEDLTPARIDVVTSIPETLRWLTADDVKAAVAHYLVPANGFTVQVLPTPAG